MDKCNILAMVLIRGAHLSPPFISLYSIDFFNKSPFKRLQTTDNKKMKQKNKVYSKKIFYNHLKEVEEIMV